MGLFLALCSGALAKDRLVVGVLPFVSSAPLFIAADEGYFEALGLEVEFKTFRAAQPVALAVASNDLDIGVTGLTAGFFNLASVADLRLFAAQSRVVPGYQFLAYCLSRSAASEGVAGYKQLAGRRLGMTQQGSTFHYMWGRLAEAHGFSDDLRLVALESVPNMVAALQGSSIDGAILPAHIALPLERAGEATILGWVGEETPWPLGGLFADQRLLAERRDVVKRFLRAYLAGVDRYTEVFLLRDSDGRRVENPATRAVAERLTKWISASPEEIIESAPFVHRSGVLRAADIAQQMRWFQSHRLVDGAVRAEDLVDESLLIELASPVN